MTFLWGAAVAAHQVEGNNVASDWWDYEQRGLLPYKSGRACDFWNRWREDFDLVSSLGLSAFRFSVEWARLEPEPGRWDEEALNRYREMTRDLRRRGVEPVVTLHHFTLPLWFARAGGFERRENLALFERYVQKVVPALAPDVQWWVTINEPVVYAYESYSRGLWPPLKKDFGLTLRVLGNLLEAHARAYSVIHRHRPDAMVSIAKHMRVMQPWRRRHPGDRLAAYLQDYLGNEAVLRSFVTGRFLGRRIKGLAGSWDYIGLNYYSRNVLRFALDPGNGFAVEVPPGPGAETATLGWEVYPEGLYLCLRRLGRYGKPIVITENGISTDDATDPTDEKRIRFLHRHLEAMARAAGEGVDVRGYLYWSLMDNFEWAEGFDKRFGLVAVDYADLSRRPRPSAYEFSGLKERFGGAVPSSTGDGERRAADE